MRDETIYVKIIARQVFRAKGETTETSRLKSYEIHLNQWDLLKSHDGFEVNWTIMKSLEVSLRITRFMLLGRFCNNLNEKS